MSQFIAIIGELVSFTALFVIALGLAWGVLALVVALIGW